MKVRNITGFISLAVLVFPVGIFATDTDSDGLDDSVETGTGVYVSPTNTGTDPAVTDSDGDGAGDWYEVSASFTDPNVSGDKPNIPYPLPAPDSTPTATNKRVKVYILSGQSNMVGAGIIDSLGTPGTLATITRNEHKFTNLLDGTGWSVRNDVTYRGVIAALGNAPLTPDQGVSATTIGPELGFGHVMGYFHDEPVLLIKSSQGGLSLGFDLLPPDSVQYTVGGTTYAGYGDSPASWSTGTTPVPTNNYGGYQYDQCFLDEADWDTASTFAPVINVTDILDNFATEYPQWAAQGFEIAGFAWWQGWNDGLSYTSAYAYRYEQNMAQFIREIRSYYQNRYPGHISANAPFVLATAAFGGLDAAYTNQYPTRAAVINAQLAVGDPVQYPEFADNVKTMEARGYWRDGSVSPSADAGYHYNRNAETFMLVGDALGRGMLDLIKSAAPDTNAPAISSFSPINNSIGVVSMANLVLSFDETIVIGIGNITIKNLSDATQVVIAVSDATQVSVAGSALTINPTANFATENNYAVWIDTGAIKDWSDNSFAGIADDTTWNFTTAAPDTTPPTPDPLIWASAPTATSSSSIAMTASTASDPYGVEYEFDCLTAGGHGSGWQDSPTYTDTGLLSATEYTYRVRARDKSAAQNMTEYSAVVLATTDTDWFALPFRETFEELTPGDLSGRHGWIANAAEVQESVTFGGSVRAGAITGSGAYVRHAFSNGPERVWTDMRLRVVFTEATPTPEPDSTVAVYVSTNSQVMVFDGTNAVASGLTAVEDVWVRFTILSDYTTATWTLYVDDLKAGPFEFFNSTATGLRELMVDGGSTFVDNLLVIKSGGMITPLNWVQSYGGDPTLVNQDGDTLTLDQEYLIETDPTISNKFEVIALGFTSSNAPYLHYNANGLPNGKLSVSNSTDLVVGSWGELAGTLSTPADNVVQWTGNSPAGTNDFLRIYVTEKPEAAR